MLNETKAGVNPSGKTVGQARFYKDDRPVPQEEARLYESGLVPAFFAHLADHIVESVDIQEGDRILDVGCGTGVLARAIAKRNGREDRIVGIDLNEAMLAVARDHSPKIKWQQGNACELPFPDASFQIVLSQGMMNHCPEPVTAFREMWRIQDTPGKLVVAFDAPFTDTSIYYHYTEVVRRVCSPEAIALFDAICALGERGNFTDILAEAGIAHAQVRRWDCPVYLPSIENLVEADVKATAISDFVDDETYQKLLSVAQDELAVYCKNDGSIESSLPVFIVTARKA